jgi:Tfp pilus assembly protein PilO
VKPVAEIRQAEYVKSPFVMTVSTPTYHALGKFISALENSKDVYIFDSVDISTSENEANKLTATMTLSTIALTD